MTQHENTYCISWKKTKNRCTIQFICWWISKMANGPYLLDITKGNISVCSVKSKYEIWGRAHIPCYNKTNNAVITYYMYRMAPLLPKYQCVIRLKIIIHDLVCRNRTRWFLSPLSPSLYPTWSRHVWLAILIDLTLSSNKYYLLSMLESIKWIWFIRCFLFPILIYINKTGQRD